MPALTSAARRFCKTPLFSLPLVLVQPLLHRIVMRVRTQRPGFFMRLGACRHKTYLIDPSNLPFVFALRPDPDNPVLRAYRRGRSVPWDARICGTFLTLLDMIEGRLDGDALFFTRDLRIEGDTEAVVALRNACDDLDGSLADDVLAAFGPFAPLARRGLDILHRKKETHA